MRSLAAPLVLALLAAAPAARAQQAESFTFSMEEVAPRRFEFGGYVEGRLEGFAWDRSSPLRRLREPADGGAARSARATATTELRARYRVDAFSAFVSGQLYALHDTETRGAQEGTLFEAFAAWQPRTGVTLEAGKRVTKWGRGFAWNPVGFVERPKDPTDPDLAREGFWMVTGDFVRSFTDAGPLQTLGVTPVLLPVTSDLNTDFGPRDTNAAIKLYALVADTDIGLYALAGGSRSARFGADFARNLASNLVVYGEAAWLSAVERQVIGASNRPRRESDEAVSAVLGLRWLSESELTVIVEYYRNGPGFTNREYGRFLSFADAAVDAFNATGAQGTFQQAQRLAPAYQRPQPLRDYLFLRLSQKEPFNWLYVTPAVTVIADVAGRSVSLAPEITYTGFSNVELRLRGVVNAGARDTDFGARPANARVELRARFFF